MRMRYASRLFGPLAVLAVVSVLACNPKRPPAVLSGGTGSAVPAEEPAGEGRTESQESDLGGNEIQAIGSETASGTELPYALSGEEGGPLADIFYEFDQAGLTDAARATLTKHAAWLRARPRARVAVEGHCDERGTVEYNLALGDKRALAARDFLISLGVPSAQLDTVSFGKERPLDAGHDDSAWARNRRAHFAVTQ